MRYAENNVRFEHELHFLSKFSNTKHMEDVNARQGISSKISQVLTVLSVVFQLNNLGLSKCSSVRVAKIRFVRIRTLHSGQWIRLSCIMEPVKRFSHRLPARKCTL